jgi:transposase InsO family protein
MAYENTDSKPEIHHSDQGSEYKSQDYVGELVEAVYLTIDYYNSKRIHTALSMTPKEFRNEYNNKFYQLNKLSSVSGG